MGQDEPKMGQDGGYVRGYFAYVARELHFLKNSVSPRREHHFGAAKGQDRGYVSARLGRSCPMLGVGWTHGGLCWPMLDQCWAYVGVDEAHLDSSWLMLSQRRAPKTSPPFPLGAPSWPPCGPLGAPSEPPCGPLVAPLDFIHIYMAGVGGKKNMF